MKRGLFWLLVAVTLANYAIMVAWSLPYIASEAGGLAPFDMRLSGYSFAEAQAFLAALSPAGNAFYQTTQHWLDLFFPGLMAATVFSAIAALLPPKFGHWRHLIAAPVILTAIFDWSENAAVGAMLDAGAESLTVELAEAANRWTIAKATVSTAAYSFLLVLLIWKGVARWRRRSQA
ncbi:MAG: hypothetical protein JJ911_03255 [Rhizobiaceae bacterium]|nr:hypothetical protein [Rhizobiaceae bacterium]